MTRTWLFGACVVVVAACGGGGGSGECGDGTRDSDEACDDGNTADGDGCSAVCTLEIPPGCGDGVVAGDEQCDTGGESATCDLDCTLPACGDAIHNGPAGEACDDGNTADGDGCSADCLLELPAFCGDGNVGPDEACDDGGATATCDPDCTPVACGDTTINSAAGEQCDDGNTTPGDGCSATCQIEACGVATLACGGSQSGDTGDPAATSVVDTYGCYDGDKSGPEMIYEFVPTASGHADVFLEGSAPLDLFVVEAAPGCGVGACLAEGHAGTNLDVVAGHHYLVIVDTAPGTSAPFLVGIFCN